MRFVVSHRRTGSSGPDAGVADRLRAGLQQLPPELRDRVQHAAEELTAGRHVAFIDCEESEQARLRDLLGGDSIVEPLDARMHHSAAPSAAIAPLPPFRVQVHSGARPVAGISVTLVSDPAVSQVLTADEQGRCAFVPTDAHSIPNTVFTGSKAGVWSALATSVADDMVLVAPPLAPAGPLAWWHDVVRVGLDLDRGGGITVGVIDGGLGQHACLSHVEDLGAIVDGQRVALSVAEDDHHGTVSTGLVGSRPVQPDDLVGMAPGAGLVAVSVFGPDGAHQADVSLAIDLLVEACGVDIINLSLCGSLASELEADAIAFAWEHGVVCVCAAGNDAGPVLYPAAFPQAISVTALGRRGWGPAGSVVAAIDQSVQDHGQGELYLAPFSSRGDGVTCCAPGVGLVATFPGSGWGEDSGTSLAAPVATGVLAGLLADDPAYRACGRDGSRSERALEVLLAHCTNIGLPLEAQGHGLVSARPGAG